MSNALPENIKGLQKADIYTHGHLPAAAAYCRRLNLVEVVNQLVPTQMELKPGLVVQAMVLDTLSGRTPLYHVEHFMAEQDIELLLGTSIPSTAFNDTNLARSLDAIFQAGPSKIITELGIQAAKQFSLDTTTINYDTTSRSVWGDYRLCENDPPPLGPVITQGHSKDNQPSLKQFMVELLCVERGIAILGKTLDGNSSDKNSNNRILTLISALMARHGLGAGAFVYVGDSAVVTEKNLDAFGHNLFVTRLPATYTECQRVVQQAVSSNQWVDLGILAEIPTMSNRPCASYKACETTVTLYGKVYRAVVVHSSSHDKRRQKKIDRSIEASARLLNKQLASFTTHYFCEADAQTAARRVEALSGNVHIVKTALTVEYIRKPGRPSEKKPVATKTRYRLSWELIPNIAAIEREKQLAGCFVLLTNIPTQADNSMDSKKLLLTYKGQYGVENDFAFLKDPLIVNDIFLKKPHRIDALGMILIIALMIWRLMERSMRTHLQNTKTTLIGWEKRETEKPTTFMMTKVMVGIMIAVISGQRIFLHSPNARQIKYLSALGLDLDVFLDHRYKCRPIIPQKNGVKG